MLWIIIYSAENVPQKQYLRWKSIYRQEVADQKKVFVTMDYLLGRSNYSKQLGILQKKFLRKDNCF